MKRNEIIEKLVKEGFSEKTLVKFNDRQISELSERVLSEAVTKQVKVYSMKDPNDAKEVNAMINDPKKVADMKAQGHVEVTTEEKPSAGLSKEKKSKKSKEVKEWLESIAESNFHSFTSKNEIMELVKTKLNEIEVGPNVKKGHNGVPEFMSYDAISNTEVKEAVPTTKPAPTKPKVDPGTKPRTPYSPKPGEKSKPKALKEKKNANK